MLRAPRLVYLRAEWWVAPHLVVQGACPADPHRPKPLSGSLRPSQEWHPPPLRACPGGTVEAPTTHLQPRGLGPGTASCLLAQDVKGCSSQLELEPRLPGPHPPQPLPHSAPPSAKAPRPSVRPLEKKPDSLQPAAEGLGQVCCYCRVYTSAGCPGRGEGAAWAARGSVICLLCSQGHAPPQQTWLGLCCSRPA